MDSLVNRVRRFRRRLSLVRAVDVGMSTLFYLCFALAVLVLVENSVAEILGEQPSLAGAQTVGLGLAAVCLTSLALAVVSSIAGSPSLHSVAKLLDDSLGTQDRLLTCVDLQIRRDEEGKSHSYRFCRLLQADTERRIAHAFPAKVFPMPLFGRRWTFLIAVAALCWAALGSQHKGVHNTEKKDIISRTETSAIAGEDTDALASATQGNRPVARVAPDKGSLLIYVEESPRDASATCGAQVRITGPPSANNPSLDSPSDISPGTGYENDRSLQPPLGEPERIPGKRRQYFVEPLFDEKGATKTVLRPSKPESKTTEPDIENKTAPDAGNRTSYPSSSDDEDGALSPVLVADIVKAADDALRRGAISAANFRLVKAYFERLERMR